MQNLKDEDEYSLLAMLMDYTVKYSKMVADREMNTQQFSDCKKMIKHIQEEIEARHLPASKPG